MRKGASNLKFYLPAVIVTHNRHPRCRIITVSYFTVRMTIHEILQDYDVAIAKIPVTIRVARKVY